MLLLDYMSIYIKRFVGQSVCLSCLVKFCLFLGDKHSQHMEGTNILHQGGGESFLHRGWDKHFMLKAAVALMMLILM